MTSLLGSLQFALSHYNIYDEARETDDPRYLFTPEGSKRPTVHMLLCAIPSSQPFSRQLARFTVLADVRPHSLIYDPAASRAIRRRSSARSSQPTRRKTRTPTRSRSLASPFHATPPIALRPPSSSQRLCSYPRPGSSSERRRKRPSGGMTLPVRRACIPNLVHLSTVPYLNYRVKAKRSTTTKGTGGPWVSHPPDTHPSLHCPT